METTRKGTTIIYENGIEVEINTNFVDALCKAQPAKYSKVKPGQDVKPTKENLKPVADSTKVVGEIKPTAKVPAPQSTDTDGKFTVEDLMQLEYKELQGLAKKLKIKNTQAKKSVLAKQIFEESKK